MNKNAVLQGVITALVTPMHPDGTVDFESLTNLIEFQIKNQVTAFVAIGSTGEGITLNCDEKIAIVEHVIKVTKQRAKIIVGINDIATVSAVNYTKLLNSIEGIDYYMITAPAYVRPTQEGLYQHFKAIAISSTRPTILYNVPSRTGSDVSNETVLRLANDCPNIIGFKDATANISRACELFQNRKTEFKIYSGDDATALPFVLNGGDGVISVISNAVPAHFNRVILSALAGDEETAKNANIKIKELHEVLFIESNPIPVKWALYYMGVINSPYVRLPLVPLSENAQEKVKSALINLK